MNVVDLNMSTTVVDFHTLMMQKEKELHELASSKVKLLETELKEKLSENEKLKRMYEKIRKDFQFNLDVIDERDAELERYDKAFDNVKQVVMLRDTEIRELKINIRKFQNKLQDVSQEEKTTVENFREEMKKMERDLKVANQEMQSESKRRRDAELMYQDFEKLHRAALRNEENALSGLRKQLEQDFEQRLIEERERFETERTHWKVREKDLRNAADTAQAQRVADKTRVTEDMRLEIHSLERRLKVAKWEHEDERKMRIESDQERTYQVQSEETILHTMNREYEVRLEQFSKKSKCMESVIENQKDRILMEEAEIQMLRSSSVATCSETVANHRREIMETTTRHRDILEQQLRVMSEEHTERVKQFEQDVVRQEKEFNRDRTKNHAHVEALEIELARCRDELQNWKTTSRSKRTLYEADMAHKQELLNTVEKDLDSLAKQFAKRTGSLRRECDLYAERARKFEGSNHSLQNYEHIAKEERLEQEMMSRQLRAVSAEFSEMKRAMELERSKEMDDLKRMLIIRERDEIREKEQVESKEIEELKSMYAEVLRERDALLHRSSSQQQKDNGDFTPPKAPPSNNISSPKVSKLRLVVPPVSPAFSDDMGPASPLPSFFGDMKMSPSPTRKSPTLFLQSSSSSQQQQQQQTNIQLELQTEKEKHVKSQKQIEEMRKEMISAKQINEHLKNAVKEMRREMEKIVISTQQENEDEEDRENERIHSLRREIENMKRQMNRMEREREQLMEINKRRKWEKSNTFEWAREAWQTRRSDGYPHLSDNLAPPRRSREDGYDDESVSETDAISPDLSEYTQMDSVDKSLVALREIERRALENCDKVQRGGKPRKKKNSQDTEKLILEHSNALLRAMRVKKPDITMEMRGKKVTSSGGSKTSHSNTKNSEKMTQSQKEALKVRGLGRGSISSRRRKNRRMKVRNYNLKDDDDDDGGYADVRVK